LPKRTWEGAWDTRTHRGPAALGGHATPEAACMCARQACACLCACARVLARVRACVRACKRVTRAFGGRSGIPRERVAVGVGRVEVDPLIHRDGRLQRQHAMEPEHRNEQHLRAQTKQRSEAVSATGTRTAHAIMQVQRGYDAGATRVQREEESDCRRRHAPAIVAGPDFSSCRATSAPGLGSSLPHLRRDWAHPCHICAGTGLTPPTSAPGPRTGRTTSPACTSTVMVSTGAKFGKRTWKRMTSLPKRHT
jgi:hypothetical protein